MILYYICSILLHCIDLTFSFTFAIYVMYLAPLTEVSTRISLCKLHTYPLIREGSLHEQTRNCQIKESQSHITNDQSDSISWFPAHCRTCDHILLPVRRLMSEGCSLVFVWHPLWGEVGSAFCQYQSIVICQNVHLISPICWMYIYRLQIKWGFKKKIYIYIDSSYPSNGCVTILKKK
jgi:hypothetical protein